MNLGLGLSAVGVGGFAHIGAIKALEEHGIYLIYITGTSAGTLVGALHGSRMAWKAILDFFKELERFGVAKYARIQHGLKDSTKFYDGLKHYLPDDCFDS